MAKVTIYTRAFCPYCERAKALLTRKGVAFEEIDAGMDSGLRRQMVERSGRNTFPQVFVGTVHVGGCDDLHDLDASGGLEPLLARV